MTRLYYEQVPMKRSSERWAAKFVLNGRITGNESFAAEAEAWCLERFGKQYHGHTLKYRWHMDRWTAHFRHTRDAIEFKIRWG